MNPRLTEFRINIKQCRNQDTIYSRLIRIGASKSDVDDLLRLQLVLAVSALDLLIHQIVHDGVLECARGNRLHTKKFLNLRPSLSSIMVDLTTISEFNWLSDEIRYQHGLLAFQKSDKINDAIKLFSKVRLWDSVASRLSMDRDDVTKGLDLIAQRRNQIVHEFDSDALNPGSRLPIYRSDVQASVTLISKIGHSIVYETRII